MQRQKPTQKQKRTLPKNLQEGFFIFVPALFVQKIAQLLNIRDIPQYTVQVVAQKSLGDFLSSDLFFDYRLSCYDVSEILDTFEAEIQETIEEIKQELKNEKKG
jgi:predicted DNA-binding transcriptional regulator